MYAPYPHQHTIDLVKRAHHHCRSLFSDTDVTSQAEAGEVRQDSMSRQLSSEEQGTAAAGARLTVRPCSGGSSRLPAGAALGAPSKWYSIGALFWRGTPRRLPLPESRPVLPSLAPAAPAVHRNPSIFLNNLYYKIFKEIIITIKKKTSSSCWRSSLEDFIVNSCLHLYHVKKRLGHQPCSA
jgi:hypothetical protein